MRNWDKHDQENPLPARVSIKRAGEYLDCSDKTIRRRIADGSLKAHRIGPQSIRIDRESLLALAEANPLGGVA
jgi:excisionase family DNA binding protein